MIADHIGHVGIHVKTDLPDTGELRPAAERIVRATLERCAEMLEARWPGRLVIVRSLPLRWRTDGSLFEDDAAVEDLARSTADSIERLAVSNVTEQRAERAPGVIFEDEAHFRASHLLALARGAPRWFHASLQESDLGSALAFLALPEQRALAWATLIWLARENALAEVLARVPAPLGAVFASALGVRVPTAEAEPQELVADAADQRIAAELTKTVVRWPALAPVARLLALRVHASVIIDKTPESREAEALAESVVYRIDRDELDHEAGARERFDLQEPLEAQIEPRPSDTPAARETEVERAKEAVESVATRCVGLFYLLDRMQELNIPESLWKACLPEGTILAAAMSALLGPAYAADTAPLFFGGVDAPVDCPTVTLEQQEEVALATCSALAAALPRRGLAKIPASSLALIDHVAGRLLVASADGSPFAFFAWPAGSASAILRGLQAFLGTWPHKGLITAAPGLASLDGSGRVRPRKSGEMAAVPIFVPEARSAGGAALLTVVAGAPCMLFAERAAFVGDRDDFVRRIARPGRVQSTPGEMDVILRGEDVDYEARQAGLDRDPGYLPWLRRKVRFVFEDGERAQ